MKLDNLNQLYVRCSSHRSPIRYASYHANQAEIKLSFRTPPMTIKFASIQLIYGTTILCGIFYHSRYRINRKWFLANFVKRFRNKSLICAKCRYVFPLKRQKEPKTMVLQPQSSAPISPSSNPIIRWLYSFSLHKQPAFHRCAVLPRHYCPGW